MADLKELATYIMSDQDALSVASEDISDAIASDLEHFFQDEKDTFTEEDVAEAWETDDDYFSWMAGDVLYLMLQADHETAAEYLRTYFEPWDGPGFGMDLKEENIEALKKLIGDELLGRVLDAGREKQLF